MAEQISRLKVKIANAKRKITNVAKFVEGYVAERDYPVLEKRKQDIDKEFTEFENWYTELEALVEDPTHADIRTEYEEKYYAAYGKLMLFLKDVAAPINNLADPIASTHSQSIVNGVNTNIVQTSKRSLPRVNLPSFSGSYEAWLGFHDLFKSLVDDDQNIPEIEKLYHLKGCLRDEAAEVLASIELSAENYRVAWSLLKERYDNRKIIRQTHVKALLNLKHVSKEFPVRSLLDQVQKHVRALDALKEPVDHWNTLLVEIISQKLNNVIREKWEEFSGESVSPTFKELITFLQRRAQFEDVKSHQDFVGAQNLSDRKPSHAHVKQRSQHAYPTATANHSCSHCRGKHSIHNCETFKKLSPSARFEAAKKATLCINCLRPNHRVMDCTGAPCRKCHKKHNTLLHFEKQPPEATSASEPVSSSQSVVNLHAQVSSEGLLATAMVDIVNAQGKSKTCRAFLDAGSQAHFITESVASFLRLPRKSVDISVSGVEDISTEIKHSVSAILKSRFSKYSKTLEFLVLNRITKPMPSIAVNQTNLDIPNNVVLADPKFYDPSQIEVLIGVKLFYKLLCVGQISLKNHPEAVLQKTQLGWIVAGEINGSSSRNAVQCHFTTHSTPLDATLTKFWELENIPSVKVLSQEEQACEAHFKSNTQRNSEGRYIVRLPFNENKENLGESRSMALRRFHFLEKRFEKNPQLKVEYCHFLDEYKQLNHLSLLENKTLTMPGFYLPHHAVIREDSITTKIRVVFDGSARTSSGVSLNNALMVGPTIQDDLFTLLTRFRSRRYALTADIEKMYRQIQVHPDDTPYQKILFRKNPDETVNELSLDTVTYGTSCAPFLAIRTLHQLANDEGAQHPVAASVLKQDFYVDDLLTGAGTRQEAAFLRDDLIALLQKGGFPIRKWASNDPSLVPENSDNSSSTHMSLDPNATIKTLGIHWNSREDIIFYKVNTPNLVKTVTKRSILSQVAKLFDPLGLLGPIIVKAKIMIQLLWKAGVSWDESVPADIHTMWLEFKEQLPLLVKVSFNRLTIAPNFVKIQMHGFSDASEKAYGACIYMRSTDIHGNHHVSLVCSKSRVAPVKSLTLPRLELCAALLLARLYTTVKLALQLEINKVYLWSDSTITLHWINTEPHLLKTFVSNRIAEIQNLSESCEWRHVPTQDNPADLVSRGQMPQEFVDTRIWKNGPHWLSHEENFWPQKKIHLVEIPEKRAIIAAPSFANANIIDDDLIKDYSSLKSLKRVIAYVMRFIHNLRNKSQKHTGPISATEFEASTRILVLITQSIAFAREIYSLKIDGRVDNKSRLIPLKPFLDKQGILRVGGRLIHSELPKEQKHQIILPSDHHITRLIIREEHERLNHAGTQATLYSVRETFWPLNGRNVTRIIIHKCVRCFRAKPRSVDYIMGDLPQERVSCSRPFLDVGVDYCGPLYIKEKRFRNRNKIKVYVAIFVCMSTKAVHLELVSDLTTEAFMACLKRLFSRRGISRTIHSDNATNFVGSSRELIALHKLIQSDEHNTAIQKFLAEQKVTWNFIPPRSPHFGGLWEAAVRSFKHHLVRTVGDTLLTFEQLETCIIEIEAILNSRPLSPISPDPNDLQPLTPGHFLIGGPLTSFPEMDLTDTASNRLSAWQHAQKLRQHFWRRWQKEYLHQLTIRSKWQSNLNHCIHPGTLVVIKEDNLPPLRWKLGRIVATHPGPDGITRVATIKTDTGECKRCVKKLCPLPIECSSKADENTKLCSHNSTSNT
ncbi:uncharacterized protein LOC143306713 [Osmia lignaria lignaria]|uniref:uncharacterized protein LOC143306713 n=1 Tax=Osmia lignaria lignaria TaxID=1437193 RepID=UPI00402BDFE3